MTIPQVDCYTCRFRHISYVASCLGRRVVCVCLCVCVSVACVFISKWIIFAWNALKRHYIAILWRRFPWKFKLIWEPCIGALHKYLNVCVCACLCTAPLIYHFSDSKPFRICNATLSLPNRISRLLTTNIKQTFVIRTKHNIDLCHAYCWHFRGWG